METHNEERMSVKRILSDFDETQSPKKRKSGKNSRMGKLLDSGRDSSDISMNDSKEVASSKKKRRSKIPKNQNVDVTDHERTKVLNALTKYMGNVSEQEKNTDAHSQEINHEMDSTIDANSSIANEDNELEDDDCSDNLEEPHKFHFEFVLPSVLVKDYYESYIKETEMKWPLLGNLHQVENSNSDFIPAVPLTQKTEMSKFGLKENLLASCKANKKLKQGSLSATQLEFFSVISSYYDFLFSKTTSETNQDFRFCYCLHIVNHILKARAKIIHHNSKLSKNQDEEFRDQSFTRSTVLIIVPFREDCYNIVNTLSQILPDSNVMNKKRFDTEYGSSLKPPKRMKPKPSDFESTFAGNISEDFKMGVKVKNKSICLYSEFYVADLIITSPLGLRPVIGAEGDKDRDFDFLSSVEILILDRADVLLMQNWYHVMHVFKHMNLLPKQPHGCNFFRVRSYALDGLSKFYRQTILLSSVEHPWFKAIFHHGQCFNHSGYLRSWTEVQTPSISQVVLPMAQIFRWFDSTNPSEDMDIRFNFFISQVLPQYKEQAMAQTLVYIPCYFDFVRLRNHFRSEELSTTMICEYSKTGKVAQARDLFFKGHRHFMLYTERAHFYNRYRIKGINHILFYQLPTYPHFYSEMCNLLLHCNPRRKDDLLAENSCSVTVSKLDCIQLKYIVGMSKAKHMFNSDKKVFMITTKDS